MKKARRFIRYPRGAAEGVPVKDQPKLLERQGGSHPNFSNNAVGKAALFGLGNMMSMARLTAKQLSAEGFDVALSTLAHKPLMKAPPSFFGRAGMSSSPWKTTFCGRLWQQRAGVSAKNKSRRPLCASVGRTNLSNTPRPLNTCGRSTV